HLSPGVGRKEKQSGGCEQPREPHGLWLAEITHITLSRRRVAGVVVLLISSLWRAVKRVMRRRRMEWLPERTPKWRDVWIRVAPWPGALFCAPQPRRVIPACRKPCGATAL